MINHDKEHYINISDGKEVVKLITEIGKRNSAKVWIEFGTLLGHIRDKGFIPHDKDIDFGMEYKYWNDNIIIDLKKFGFVIRFAVNFTEKGAFKFVGATKKGILAKMRLRYKDINICFNIYHEGVDEYKNYMYSCAITEKSYLIELPKNLLVPQLKATFYGLGVWIPENYMESIEYVYGKNWHEPTNNYAGSKEHSKNSKKFKRKLL